MADLIEVTVDRIDIISVGGKQGMPGITGPRGLPGPAGGSSISYPAGVALGGHCVVMLNATGQLVPANPADVSCMGRILGVTTGSTAIGASCQVQNFDQMQEPSWNWDVTKPVYLGVGGVLTQTPPTQPNSKFSMVVGRPVSSTVLFITLREPIALST